MSPDLSDEALDLKVRDVLIHYFARAKPSKEEHMQAQLASSTFSTISRRQQTAGAREATALLFARTLVTDTAEREKYMRAALPASQFVKALPPTTK